MTKDMFFEWLDALNNKMRAQKRNILLLLDNCSAHPDIELSNIKLVFLPPRTTSHLQPCDAGIIQAVKLQYRTKFVRHLLLKMDEANTASELAKSVTLLHAILWLKHAWDCLQSSTIIKCLRKCGVSDDMTPVQDAEQSVDEHVPTPIETTSSDVLGDVTWDEFMSFDNELAVTSNSDGDWEDHIIAKAFAANGSQVSDPESDEEENESAVAEPAPVVSGRELHSHLERGLQYALQKNNSTLLELINKTMTEIETSQLKEANRSKQKDIHCYIASKPKCNK